MSITDTVPVAKHKQAVNEILSIQKAAIDIASNGLYSRLDIHKKPVDEYTLDYLAVYFLTQIKTDGEDTFICILSDHACIFVKLEKKEDAE